MLGGWKASQPKEIKAMANKSSPFKYSFIKICYVAPPGNAKGDQHIFQIGKDGERMTHAFCGAEASQIHKDRKGRVDVVESKERVPDRPLCIKCEDKYKRHPSSPWDAWMKAVDAMNASKHDG
jgi:hypothetical protein